MTRSPRGTQVGLLRLRAGDGLRPVRETVPGPPRFSQADDGAPAARPAASRRGPLPVPCPSASWPQSREPIEIRQTAVLTAADQFF